MFFVQFSIDVVVFFSYFSVKPLSIKLIKLFIKFHISIFVFMWLNSPVFSLCFIFLTEVGNNNVMKMIQLHFWKTSQDLLTH